MVSLIPCSLEFEQGSCQRQALRGARATSAAVQAACTAGQMDLDRTRSAQLGFSTPFK